MSHNQPIANESWRIDLCNIIITFIKSFMLPSGKLCGASVSQYAATNACKDLQGAAQDKLVATHNNENLILQLKLRSLAAKIPKNDLR